MKHETLVSAHVVPTSHLTDVIPEPRNGPSHSQRLTPLTVTNPIFLCTSAEADMWAPIYPPPPPQKSSENTGQPDGLET